MKKRGRPYGLSIHIGADILSYEHYAESVPHGAPVPWFPANPTHQIDALKMIEFARSRGFHAKLFMGTGATSQALFEALTDAGDLLCSGDMLLLTFAGHGGAVIDIQEPQRLAYCTSWVLYDRMFVNDEFDRLWTRFRNGVRIVVVSDSCFSGSIITGPSPSLAPLRKNRTGKATNRYSARSIPPDVILDVYERRRRIYDAIQIRSEKYQNRAIEASIVLLAACRSNQLARNNFGLRGGFFTNAILRAMKDDPGDYTDLVARARRMIKKRISTQDPHVEVRGSGDQLVKEPPFTIKAPAAK